MENHTLSISPITRREQMDQIIRLCDQAFPNPIAQRESYGPMLDKLASFGIFFVATLDDAVGYASMYATDQQTKTAFMTLLAVRPGCQGMGVGKALMERCLASARENGMKQVRLEVRKDNLRAIRMYEKYGFAADGQQTDHSIFMTKPLV